MSLQAEALGKVGYPTSVTNHASVAAVPNLDGQPTATSLTHAAVSQWGSPYGPPQTLTDPICWDHLSLEYRLHIIHLPFHPFFQPHRCQKSMHSSIFLASCRNSIIRFIFFKGCIVAFGNSFDRSNCNLRIVNYCTYVHFKIGYVYERRMKDAIYEWLQVL